MKRFISVGVSLVLVAVSSDVSHGADGIVSGYSVTGAPQHALTPGPTFTAPTYTVVNSSSINHQAGYFRGGSAAEVWLSGNDHAVFDLYAGASYDFTTTGDGFSASVSASAKNDWGGPAFAFGLVYLCAE